MTPKVLYLIAWLDHRWQTGTPLRELLIPDLFCHFPWMVKLTNQCRRLNMPGTFPSEECLKGLEAKLDSDERCEVLEKTVLWPS